MKVLALAVLLAASAAAHAEWSAHLQVEHFRWTEKVGSPDLTETGARFGVGLAYEQDAGQFLFRYRGTAYAGSPNQKGEDPVTGAPRQGKTDYGGIANEAQFVYRGDADGLNPLVGVGLDYWVRTLPFSRQEQTWRVGFVRAGIEAGTWRKTGWSSAIGIKYPFWNSINANFDEAGFTDNPALEPRGAVSAYGEVGYRFSRRWKIVGYYDSYRFGQSPSVTLTTRTVPAATTTTNQARSAMDALGVRLQYFF